MFAAKVRHVGQSKQNTTNGSYDPNKINVVGVWTEFNIDDIMHEFGPLLRAIRIQRHTIRSPSPQRELTSESGLHLAFGEYIHALIRRSLRCTFERLDNRAEQRAEPQVDPQAEPQAPSQPEDLLFNQVLDRVLDVLSERTNILIGSPSMMNSSFIDPEFFKPLAQVNWYMTQHGTQFGFILTDQELVPIQRVDDDGNLKLGAPIPWTQTGTSKEPQLTVALGLWYLGMLTADDTLYRARQ
ncbi:hypothetical protein CBS147332_2687 [Penicillium roqueforti]|nr:hypothetical protein CBS147332_2687 [Penicillium roqueforti]KAI3099814.1 hypothetical protein CBS147331_8516 [Penicillium roqueforti]